MPTDFYSLSLHDALPISRPGDRQRGAEAEEEDGVVPHGACASIAEGGLKRSEEHTSELQSLRHLVCRPISTLFPYTTLFRSPVQEIASAAQRPRKKTASFLTARAPPSRRAD